MFKDINPSSIVDFTPEMEKFFHFVMSCHVIRKGSPKFSIISVDTKTYLIQCIGQGNDPTLRHLVYKQDVNEFYEKNKDLFHLLFNRQLN